MMKDLLYFHQDLFMEVMEANETSKGFMVCPKCKFKTNHKDHSLSVESAINRLIQHVMDKHK